MQTVQRFEFNCFHLVLHAAYRAIHPLSSSEDIAKKLRHMQNPPPTPANEWDKTK